MKIFKLTPVNIPNINKPTDINKIVGIAGRIVSGDVGEPDTKHTYYVEFYCEITIDEVTTTEPFSGTNLETTQEVTGLLMNPQTQYAAVSALATQYGYTLLPENQQ